MACFELYQLFGTIITRLLISRSGYRRANLSSNAHNVLLLLLNVPSLEQWREAGRPRPPAGWSSRWIPLFASFSSVLFFFFPPFFFFSSSSSPLNCSSKEFQPWRISRWTNQRGSPDFLASFLIRFRGWTVFWRNFNFPGRPRVFHFFFFTREIRWKTRPTNISTNWRWCWSHWCFIDECIFPLERFTREINIWCPLRIVSITSRRCWILNRNWNIMDLEQLEFNDETSS